MARKTPQSTPNTPAQMTFSPTKAAIYLRVSTDEQVNGYGLDVQRQRCEAMAIVKGWTVTAVYSDEGLSGTLDATKRPGLAAMLDAACNGEVDAVIVLSLDRLARKTLLVLDIVGRLDGCAVELVSVKESLDTSTPSGRFALTMFAAIAQLERDTIVQRTTDGRNARGAVDGERGGSVPMGYRRERNDTGAAVGVSIVDSEAETVRTIFSLRAGGASLRTIAACLNDDGIPARKGGRWYASAVKEVLSNEAEYRGGRRGASDETWPVILND